MIEATFPLLGTAFVVLVVLPVFALLAKLGLVLLERDEVLGPLGGLNLRYILLTGSSMFPLAWLMSAGLHQAETGRSVLACLLDHDTAELCLEPGFFALILSGAVVVAALRLLRKQQEPRASSTEVARALSSRLERIISDNSGLAILRRRVRVTEDGDFALGTCGWFAPRVFIGAAFASRLSDAMLASALAHEAEHVRALDPLRYLILQLSLAVNPCGRFFLEPHAARWRAALESHCDREAVVRGAAPLALADAIVRAARPGAQVAAGLGAPDTAVLELRVGMLLAFAERAPHSCPHHQGLPAFPMAFTLLVVAMLLPHQTGTAALDVLHMGAEHTVTYFWP